MYSGSVATWVSGSTVPATQRRGWMGQLWTAINTTTAQPDVDSADWQLDTPVRVSGVSLLQIPDPKDFLKTKVTGVTFIATHISRPPEVRVTGITVMKYRSPSFVIISED